MYQPDPATEKQHKYWVYLCKGLKGMTAPEMGKLEERFMKKFKIDRWSDITKDQITGPIDFVNQHWVRGKKYDDFITHLYF